MTKVLIATVKPFIPAAVKNIKKIVSSAGYELLVLERYADQAEFVDAVADADYLVSWPLGELPAVALPGHWSFSNPSKSVAMSALIWFTSSADSLVRISPPAATKARA